MALSDYVFPPKPNQWDSESLRTYIIAVRDSYVIKTAEYLIPSDIDTTLFNIAILVIKDDSIWGPVSTILLKRLVPENGELCSSPEAGTAGVSKFEVDIANELMKIIK